MANYVPDYIYGSRNIGRHIVFIEKSNIATRQIFCHIYDANNIKSINISLIYISLYASPIAKEDGDIKGIGYKSSPITRYI